jgi:ribonuclease-3
MDEKQFGTFEKSIGIPFNDRSLLVQAFTHRSYLNEHKEEPLEHNERLEFLGDAVLELIATEYLFRKYPERQEGELTAFRAALVNTVSLSTLAKKLGVEQYLLLSKGEAKDAGRARQYILADTFEALIGAIFLDQGFAAAQQFIEQNLLPQIDEIVEKKLWQDPKSRFQEEAQDRVGVTPTYMTLKEEGPDHDKYFEIGVYLDERLVGTGEGKSKQEAEQEAARKALLELSW